MEKGQLLPLEKLEKENAVALKELKKAVDGCKKDWGKFFRQAAEFHNKNALGWANAQTGAGGFQGGARHQSARAVSAAERHTRL